MIFCKNTANTLFFSSIKEISEQIWQQLNCEENLYFNRQYLLALEQNNSKIPFSYIVLLNKAKKAIALATIQIIDLPISSIGNTGRSEIEKFRCFGRKLFFLKEKSLKILVCGNSFVSGEHGFFIAENEDKKKVIKSLVKAILHFIHFNETLKKELHLLVLKDFTKQSLLNFDELHDYRYYSLNVEPNMQLKIDENWHSFNDYLLAMRTKFRVKAKKAISLSEELKQVEVTTENINEQLPKMTSLYKKVATKADFNLADFNLNTYKDLKESLGDNYIVTTYWLNNKIVGFLSGIINQENLDAHFVGIDYKLNKTHAIYQRMLYDYIKIAIAKRLKTVNFGRTASEIKSSVGAVPQHLTIYVRHKKPITNRLLKPFLQHIEPTFFRQNFPFKTNNLTE